MLGFDAGASRAACGTWRTSWRSPHRIGRCVHGVVVMAREPFVFFLGICKDYKRKGKKRHRLVDMWLSTMFVHSIMKFHHCRKG